MEIRYLGHSAFSLSDGDTTVLVDPFLTGNPKAATSADEPAGNSTPREGGPASPPLVCVWPRTCSNPEARAPRLQARGHLQPWTVRCG